MSVRDGADVDRRRHRRPGPPPLARPVAELRVRGERRVFVATSCVVDGQLVHAIGRWRGRVGANYSDERWSAERSYTYPADRLERVRWLEHELAGLDVSAEIVGMP